MNPLIINIAIEQLPALIKWFKDVFHKKHPDEPLPTDQEAIAGLNSAFVSSLTKDDAWLAAHPKNA